MSPKCHACGEPVRSAEDACPVCGVLLRHTVLDGAADTTADDDAAAGSATGTGSIAFEPGSQFAERYTIIEQLGEGGMGVVYKAIDRTLDSLVTLKLIQPSLAQNPAFVSRFKREARITRQITHPNVCRVHDIGESENVLFISMEWIEGETLQQLLRQAGMLPEARALEFAARIAEALEAAHERGIVHRDLKPANVMVDRRGVVHVLDFGLALDVEAQQLTGADAVVGTPLYMAPEQRAGDAVDARSDLYALGLVLLEMLAGRRAIPDPQLTESLPSELNPKLAPLLQRLLAWLPEDRFASAAAAREEIDRIREDPTLSGFSTVKPRQPSQFAVESKRGIVSWLPAMLIVLAAAVIAALVLRGCVPSGHPVDDLEARDFYERGMTLLNNDYHTEQGLEQARNMFVRASDLEPDSPVILARLGLVYWSLYQDSREPARRDEAERYLRKATELDAGCAELRHAKAFGLIVEGLAQAAREELERSLESKPRQPMAWADLANALWVLDEYGAAERALAESARRDAGAFRTSIYRGMFHAHFAEYDRALEAYRRAAELNPDASVSWYNSGAMLLQLGRPDEAVEAMVEAFRLERDAWSAKNVGTVYYQLKRYDEAERYYRMATEMDPDDALSWSDLADTLAVQQRADEAREAYGRAAEVARNALLVDAATPEDLMRAAVYSALAGDAEPARDYSARALRERPDDGSLLLKLSRVHGALGEDELALEALLRAAERGVSRAQIENYPDLARLAGDPRYARALELAQGD